MNYIIDPKIFYWMHVMSGLKIICGILGGIATAGMIVAICSAIYNYYNSIVYGHDKEHYMQYMCIGKKAAWITAILGIVFLAACVFLPDKETSIQMLVSKAATFDNVGWTVSQVKEIVDYIVQAIKTI